MKIVAVVNDEVITQSDLNKALAPVYLQLQAAYGPQELANKAKEIREKVLQQLVEERLLIQEARSPHSVELAQGKTGTPPPVAVSDNEVEERMHEVIGKFKNPEDFSSALSEQGLTLDDLKSRYRDQIMVQKLVGRELRSRISVSPSEVTTEYNAHFKDYQVPPAVQASVLVIKPKDVFDEIRARDLANGLREQILQGADFADLVKRYSDGPNVKMGGRVGFLEQGKSYKEIDDVIFTLKVGDISPVIKASAGLHIFKIEALRPARQSNLEEVKSQIQERLFEHKFEAQFQEWMQKLKARAYIDIQDKS